MGAKLSLVKLREMAPAPAAIERLGSSHFAPGVACGQLSEVSGDAKFEWLLGWLAEHPELAVIWMEHRFATLPTAAHQRGVNLSKVVFVEAREDLFHHLRTALRSQAFRIVIAPSEFHDVRQLIALRTLSKESAAATVLFAECPSESWVFANKIDARHSPLGLRVSEVADAP